MTTLASLGALIVFRLGMYCITFVYLHMLTGSKLLALLFCLLGGRSVMKSMLQSKYGLVGIGRGCILPYFLWHTGLMCLHIEQVVVYRCTFFAIPGQE